MRLEKIQAALKEKMVDYDYREEDGCASIDLVFRGLRYHIWEYQDGDVWGAETNIFETGRSRDIEGDYDTVISEEIHTWPLMRENLMGKK